MRIPLPTVCLLFGFPPIALAQDAPGRRDGPAVQLARAADANQDGKVTADEWRTLIQGFTNADGGIDRLRVLVRLVVPQLDRDGDGRATAADLTAAFAARDADGDGALSSDELGRRGRLGEAIALGAADADRDGTVTAAEWTRFVGSLTPGAGIADDDIAGWIRIAEAPTDAARTALTAGVQVLTLERELDADQDGRLSAADFEQLFAGLDANSDRKLDAEELRPRAAAAGEGRRGRPGRTTIDRSAPPLMPWQRTLDDALALSERTGKPLLICVNMDGESASEQLAWGKYRDPSFVDLANGFVPVIVSPDRRNPNDYDDAGRRIEDQRFGRVTNAEHIDIEPLLFERWFNGRRVAPRHVGVAPDGKILFDIFLTQGLEPIEAALRQHGVRDSMLRPADSLSEEQLLASPDASHRAFLEERFAKADRATRLRLTAAALADGRRTQHPDLLRMALRDGDPAVRLAAARAIGTHAERAPVELLPAALRVAHGDAAVTRAIADGAARLAASTKDEALQKRARRLARVFATVGVASRLVDTAKWRAAIAKAPAAERRTADVDALDAELSELEAQRRRTPDDKGIDARIAWTTLRFARARMQQGGDPRLLLEDAAAAGQRAAPDPRALGVLAAARYLLNDPAQALEHATAALPRLADEAASELGADVLDAFARCRVTTIYAALGEEAEWPASWIPDARDALDVLVDHPFGSEDAVAFLLDFESALETFGPQPDILRRGLTRFPGSVRLHGYARLILAADEGAAGLERFYATFAIPEGATAPWRWFGGLASLVAAERHVQNRQVADALAAYERAVTGFAASIGLDPSFADSANHYVCLAHAGRARLLGDAGDWAVATAALQHGLAARPASAALADGLGNTPAGTAGRLLAAMRRAGATAEVESLTEALTRLGVTPEQTTDR